MVSFSCENCGDVLTKKKLDPHRGQCYGAYFTCLDCMTTFNGTDYRSHTSCISEAQKYQGALYKGEKKKGTKSQLNSPSLNSPRDNSQSLVPRKAYVEDDNGDNAIAVIDVPPQAPSPPPAAYALGQPFERPALLPVNVFDFLVGEQSPVAPRVEFANGDRPQADESRMIEDRAPPSYEEIKPPVPPDHTLGGDGIFKENGFAYGAGPVPPSMQKYDSWVALPTDSQEMPPPAELPAYTTPAPKHIRDRKEKKRDDVPSTVKKDSKSDKKRKRTHLEELDMALVRTQEKEDADAMMTDAPPILHSGLTGGLHRLLRPDFPPSPDYSGGDGVEASPLSPMKRSKHVRHESLKERGRDQTRKTSSSTQQTESTRPSRRHKHRHHDDEDSQERRHRHRRHRHRRDSSSSGDHSHAQDRPTKLKAIEYNPSETSSHRGGGGGHSTSHGALVPYNKPDHHMSLSTGGKGDLFMSFITANEKGYSLNKVLKRYHRERGDRGSEKGEDEKELWKSLRLRRNERGEVVLFLGGDD